MKITAQEEFGLRCLLRLADGGDSASLTIQVARHWGCDVYVVTRSERDQGRALDLGAAWAGPYDEPVPVELDAAITFAPVGSAVVAALRALGRGATVAINAPAANASPRADSSDISLPADGIYAFGVVTSGSTAANSYQRLLWQLDVRNV